MHVAIKDVPETFRGMALLAVNEGIRRHHMRIFPATWCACSTSLRLRQEHVFCVNRHATHTLSISGVFLSFHNSVAAWKIAIRGHEKSLSQTSAEIGPGILILTSQRSCSGRRPVLNKIPSS